MQRLKYYLLIVHQCLLHCFHVFHIALDVFYIALGGSVVYKCTTKRTAQLTKLNLIFDEHRRPLAPSNFFDVCVTLPENNNKLLITNTELM